MPNDDVINIVNEHHANERAKQEQAKAEKSRVSNDKGEVIGIVTFFSGIKNQAKYILADRKRSIALMAALTVGVVGADVAMASHIKEEVDTHKAIIETAQEASVNEAISALETDTYTDDNAVLDYFLGSVVANPADIKPNDVGKIHDDELRNRLTTLYEKMNSLSSGETLGVDRDALIKQYKEEYAAIVKTLQDRNIYYNYDANIEKASASLK